MTARTAAPVRDANGDLAALIKVVTTATGFDFDGGSLGIVKVDWQPGEVWVYVPPGARMLTIRHPQLGVLRNYAYPVSIASGNVYELRLVSGEIEVSVKERQILTEFVIIDSEPRNADVYLNNELVGKTPFSSAFPEGRYEWRLVSDLYLPEAGVFELKAGGKQKIAVKLKPNFGSIQVTSLPESGANITLNGVKLGKATPHTMTEIPVGEHIITLTHDSYETTTQKAVVSPGETEVLSITMEPNFAELVVSAQDDEEVYINGVRRGTGRFSARLAPGVYSVEVRKSGHRTATRQLSLKRGDKEILTLRPEPIFSTLQVVSEPIDAEIYLNGKLVGTTPHILRELVVGEYEVELRLEGYKTEKRNVTVWEGEQVELSLCLGGLATLAFTSEPSGAEVMLNGEFKGRTPIVLDVEEGNYMYEFRKEGYDVLRDQKKVSGGQRYEIAKRMLAAKGSVDFRTEPTGVDLYLAGEYKGVTPVSVVDLKPGKQEYELRKDGYETLTGSFTVEAGDKMNVTRTLTSSRKSFEPEMVFVSGGTFRMGCTKEQNYCDDDESPVLEVSVANFQIGKYEVTQGQWKAVMGNNPSKFDGCDECPVERVSWVEVHEFIDKLNKMTGKSYRLPTEAEWEYAARGGNRGIGFQFSGGNTIDDIAWHKGNSGNKIQTVGQKKPNQLGIHDMSGNVWEWCETGYGPYAPNAYIVKDRANPNGEREHPVLKVIRGGSAGTAVNLCRVSSRDYRVLVDGHLFLGVRLAHSLR